MPCLLELGQDYHDVNGIAYKETATVSFRFSKSLRAHLN